MTIHIDANVIRQQIENLLTLNPQLAEDEQLRADMVEGSTDLHEFLRVVERRRQEAESMVEAINLNIETLNKRQDRFVLREGALRLLMFKLLSIADVKKVEMPEATVSVRNGTAKVIISDEDAIPDDYCSFKRTPNKQAIKAVLETGADVPGCCLSNGEPTISIRTR